MRDWDEWMKDDDEKKNTKEPSPTTGPDQLFSCVCSQLT
jgi:hypothetical protein